MQLLVHLQLICESGTTNMSNQSKITVNMYSITFLVVIFLCFVNGCESVNKTTQISTTTAKVPVGCVCGVFLSGQFKKGSKEQPTGNAVLMHDQPESFPCTSIGNRLCINKCLETIVKYLPNSSSILCGLLDRDCHKERAYLFVKNCKNEWINTNLSAGREYCCKDGASYKC